MVHKKKQDDVDDDANKATTNGSGTTIIISATMTAADTTTSPRRNRSGRSGGRVGVLINTGLSITLFFALVQFFDPSLSKHREDDIAHHHWNHNPILSSLTDFAQGKDGLQRLRNNSNSSASSSITSRSQVSAGRERILSLLEEAGIAKDLSNSQIERLPKWEQVSSRTDSISTLELR